MKLLTLIIACLSFLQNIFAQSQWQLMSNGNTAGTTYGFVESSSGVLIAGTADGIYTSANYGGNWALSNSGINSGAEIVSITKNSAGIFAGSYNEIYFSSNSGTSWTIVNNAGVAIESFAVLNDTVYAATNGLGILMTPNNGATWITVNTGLLSNAILSVVTKGNLLFAGDMGNGVYISSNSGANWTLVNAGLPAGVNVKCLETDGTNLYAGTIDFSNSNGMFISANNGTSWTQVTNGIATNAEVYDIKNIGNTLLAATGTDVNRSLNNGNAWSIFMNGMSPSPPYGIGHFYETALYVFCGLEVTSGGSVYRIDKSAVLASVNEISHNFLLTLSPNPFSTQTTLQTAIPLHNATLTVDNCFGQTVAQIKNISGQTITFHRDNLASGLYFVRLTNPSPSGGGTEGGGSEVFTGKLVITD
ncbi:MAG: T9SS type A sorting domain-containing protein [Bacteroidetes bacterium]|nr:T9SS type A sorting domain-containing protein [Bacteroidota bacterium]